MQMVPFNFLWQITFKIMPGSQMDTVITVMFSYYVIL